MDFERLLRLAARVVDMPMAAITVVERGRHTAPYVIGMENPGGEVYICSYAIRCNDLVIITDTMLDPMVSSMKVVTHAPHIRFYAGAPLISPAGKRLGTLAVMDTKPRLLTEQQKEDIRILAAQVMVNLEVRRQREELHELAESMQEAQQLAHLGRWEWERDGDRLTWSHEMYRIFGRNLNDPVSNFSDFLRHVQPDDRGSMASVRRDCLERHASYELSYRITRTDGQTGFIYERGKTVFDNEGKAIGLFGFAQDVTRTRLAEEARLESEDLFRSMFEQAAVGMCLTRLDGKFVKVNCKFAALLGYAPDELSQLAFQDVTHPDDLAADLALVGSLLAGERDTYSLEKRYLHKQGREVWSNLTVSIRRDGAGRPMHFIAVVEDITARKQAEAGLREQRQLMSDLIDALPVNIYLKDVEGRYLMFNEEAARTAGVSKREAMGKTDFDIFPSRIAREIRAKDQRVLQSMGQTLEEATIVTRGMERVMLAGRKAMQGNPQRLLGFAIDIHDHKQSELRAQYLASHDPLTGLPNRTLLLDRLDHAIARSHRLNHLVAVMFLDLDRFKLINDSFGHQSGDQLLNTMAARLRELVREGDTVARLGGDEFVILLEDLTSEDEAARAADAVLTHLSRPVTLNSHELVVSTSIGISVVSKHNQDPGTLLKEADIAMYQAKGEGGNCVRYFDRKIDPGIFERLLTENALRRAVEGEELRIRYQPFVDLRTGRVAGMEALVRWEHPQRGLLGPNEFLHIAEETGLIFALGEWVLRGACRQQREWRDKGLDVQRVSVNLSAKQFSPLNLVQVIRSVLDETGIAPSLLKLEITETGLMQDMARATDALLELAGMGVELAIDDFGTGYSSLAYLKALPMHTVKIDRSFVSGVATDADDAAIVTATIGLARHLGLRVIAEGLESEDQLAFVTRHGCDMGQGYYFSPPLPPDDMEDMLRTGRRFDVSPAKLQRKGR